MQTTDNRVNWCRPNDCMRISSSVDNAGMPATGNDHKTFAGVDCESCILRNVVLKKSLGFVDRSLCVKIAFLMSTRDRSGEPYRGGVLLAWCAR